MNSGNPTLSAGMWEKNVTADTSNVMTLQGAVNKCFIMFGLVVAMAIVAWGTVANRPELLPVLWGGGAIAGLVLALVACFMPSSTPVTAPLYAVAEGLFIGAVSMIFEDRYHGIVRQAVFMTFGVFAMMLFLYKIRALQATPGFVKGVIAATGAIFLCYVVSWVMMLFGAGSMMAFMYSSGPLGIGISVAIVVVAALNLIIDFGVIEQSAATGQEKYMEWYAAFGLTVTLVWLYLEILRLLAKMRR